MTGIFEISYMVFPDTFYSLFAPNNHYSEFGMDRSHHFLLTYISHAQTKKMFIPVSTLHKWNHTTCAPLEHVFLFNPMFLKFDQC